MGSHEIFATRSKSSMTGFWKHFLIFAVGITIIKFRRRLLGHQPKNELARKDPEVHQLINGENFHVAELQNVTLLQTPDIDVCNHKNVFLVTSHPKHFQLRSKIRKTIRGRDGVIFLAGQKDEKTSRKLESENRKNGDILQGTMPDSYKHLAHQIILGFLWIEKNCPAMKKPKFITKLDDDTEFDYEQLESALGKIDLSDHVIACPSVARGQKILRDPDAPIAGKYSPSPECQGTMYPDFCFGYLYTMSQKTSLLLADVARYVPSSSIGLEDYYLTGYLREEYPDIKLMSMAPVGGTFLWENFLTFCPVLSFLRVVFNPILLRSGSPELQYVNNPKFVFCVFQEYVNYFYLKPLDMFQESWKIYCSR